MKDAIVIVNPAAGGGATGRRWPSIEQKLRDQGFDFDVALTTRPGESIEIARREVTASRPLVVAAGGDGTIGDVVNGFFEAEQGITTTSRLGILPLGTGGDFRRTFGIDGDPLLAARVLTAGRPRRIDAGRVSFKGHDGREATRYFINIADAGVGGEVVDRVNRSRKRLGGNATFMLASLAALARWRNKPMSLDIDGHSRHLVAQQVVVANCEYYGSGMRIAPMARPDDGLFDVIVVGDVGMVENMRGLSRIRAGRHLEEPKAKFELFRARRVVVSSSEAVRLDVDGEQPGLLPATFEVMPAAIELMTPAAER